MKCGLEMLSVDIVRAPVEAKYIYMIVTIDQSDLCRR